MNHSLANNLQAMNEAVWTILCADEAFVQKVALCKETLTSPKGLAKYMRDYAYTDINKSYPIGNLALILAANALKIVDWQQIAEDHFADVKDGSFIRYCRTITQRVR